MAIPTYDQFMKPLLELAADGAERTLTQAVGQLADRLSLSDADRAERLPSGTQTRIYNRVGWAISYLSKAGLLEKTARARFRIAPRGRQVLAENPPAIDQRLLERFEEFRLFKARRGAFHDSADRVGGVGGVGAAVPSAPDVTPDERLDGAYQELRSALADDLLDRVRAGTPSFFEHLVLDLLKAMGYGGQHADRGAVTGKSGDGGIDGVIPEDQLGLDMVYIQAKKWEVPVGPESIRAFVGSLGEHRAHKGVFITCGSYTKGAREAAQRANARVVLIDGEMLAELMIDHGVGVTDVKSYTIKRLDSDYFEPG